PYVLLILFGIRLVATARLGLRRFLWERFQFFRPLLRLGPIAVGTLLIVVRFVGHFRCSLPERLFLLGAPHFRARPGSRLGGGLRIDQQPLFSKPKLAEACRLESHRLPRVLLLELEVRFPLLRAAQKGFGVAPCGGNSWRIAHLDFLSDGKLARGWGGRTRRFNARRKTIWELSRGEVRISAAAFRVNREQ